jgi:kynureninase
MMPIDPMAVDLKCARALDAEDPLRHFYDCFAIPKNLVYLDGNSLGALPRSALDRLTKVMKQEWGEGLVRSWNSCDWFNSPARIGKKIAGLIGAGGDEVVVTDSTSVNVSRLVLAALELQPGRTEVLSECGNFPTDLYACEGAVRAFGRGRQLKLAPREHLRDAIGASTAVVVLTHVHYKTSELYDMDEISQLARSRGALVIWDLCHSVGALPVDLSRAGADFAVGCGYKYLNGGPGAPAFLFVADRLHERASNAICGWLGHARPFDFTDAFRPASGIHRFLAGTPSILANSALEVGVDLVTEAGIERLYEKSQRLSEFFLSSVDDCCAGLGLECVTPRDASSRGSHVSFAHPNGYEIMQALIDASVIGDFRAPDIVRFGFTPLYTRFEDVWKASQTLHAILQSEKWREPRFAVRTAVT